MSSAGKPSPNQKGDDGIKTGAHRYRLLAWSVIPLRPRDKRPLISWEMYQDHGPTPSEVDAWFRHWPRANLGIVTGRVSSLIVLDIDAAHGGRESLDRLTHENGELPLTIEAETGGGGHHIYFTYDTAKGEIRNRTAIEPGLDVRGEGGYVVAPPSIHPSGRRYRWLEGRAPGDLPIANLPSWLAERLIERRPPRRGHSLAHWQRLAHDGVTEGARNNSIASFAGHLLWHEVDPEVVLELLLCWNAQRCRPPLSDAEVARTVASIVQTHERQKEEEQNPLLLR